MSSEECLLPHFAAGQIVPGFGRGSKELGIPTANFPAEVVNALPSEFQCGVYYGWAQVSGDGGTVHKMVMCVGWNPYYHNTVKTMETHIMHEFDHDLYGDWLKIVVLGYIRPMQNYDSLDALIAAIHSDIATASQALDAPDMVAFKTHPFFLNAKEGAIIVNGDAKCNSTTTTEVITNTASKEEVTTRVPTDNVANKMSSKNLSEEGLIDKHATEGTPVDADIREVNEDPTAKKSSVARDVLKNSPTILPASENGCHNCEKSTHTLSQMNMKNIPSCMEGSAPLLVDKLCGVQQRNFMSSRMPCEKVNGHMTSEVVNEGGIQNNNNNNPTSNSICRL